MGRAGFCFALFWVLLLFVGLGVVSGFFFPSLNHQAPRIPD